MNLIPENFQSWWSHITFSVSQKRSLLSISALVIALSVFLVVRGTSQQIPLAPPELLVTESVAQVTVDVAGAENSYGHPAPNTLALLRQVGAKVLRTDTDGAIAVRARRHRLQVKTSKNRFTFLRWE